MHWLVHSRNDWKLQLSTIVSRVIYVKICCASMLCSHIFTYNVTTSFILNIHYVVRLQTAQEAVGKQSFYFQSHHNLIRWLESKTDVNWLNKSIVIWRKKAEKQFNSHLMLFKNRAERSLEGLQACLHPHWLRTEDFPRGRVQQCPEHKPPTPDPGVALSKVLPLQGWFSASLHRRKSANV